MNQARRREIWAEALVDALRAGLRRDGRMGIEVARTVIHELLQSTQDDMRDATGSDDKCTHLYERHRALSASIRKLEEPSGDSFGGS